MSCRPGHNCIHPPKSQEPWTEPPSEEAVDPPGNKLIHEPPSEEAVDQSGNKLIHQLLHRFCNSALEQTHCPHVFNVCWVILVFPIQGTLTWTTEYLTCAYYHSSSSSSAAAAPPPPLPPPPRPPPPPPPPPPSSSSSSSSAPPPPPSSSS